MVEEYKLKNNIKFRKEIKKINENINLLLIKKLLRLSRCCINIIKVLPVN